MSKGQNQLRSIRINYNALTQKWEDGMKSLALPAAIVSGFTLLVHPAMGQTVGLVPGSFEARCVDSEDIGGPCAPLLVTGLFVAPTP